LGQPDHLIKRSPSGWPRRYLFFLRLPGGERRVPHAHSAEAPVGDGRL